MDNSVKAVALPIKGFEGLYEITSDGEVFSLNYRHSGKRVKVKAYLDKDGYFRVSLSKSGKLKHYYVHRLVAEAFIPNSEGKPYIDHINTVRTDNRVGNLRWVTTYGNNHNAITKAVHRDAMEKLAQSKEWRIKVTNATIKACAKAVYCVELDKVFESTHEAARQLGLDYSNISHCCRGDHNTAGGYHFSYIENGERSFSQVVDTTDEDNIKEV